MIHSELSQRPILLDSNLSVLLCVGRVGSQYVASHKRLGSFDAIDFEILAEIIEDSASIIISPNVATETSNLARQVSGPLRDQVTVALKLLIDQADERYIASRDASAVAIYPRLGLTDSALLTILEADRSLVLLTTDHELYLAAARSGLRAYNFNHLRDRRADFQ